MNSQATPDIRFITLEGLDGCGKTAQIDGVVDFCEHHNPRGVVVTREPGGTELGERIRHILLDHGSVDADAELMLLFASRIQHVRTVIAPALARSQTVVCDRYIDATYAYQGYGRGLPLTVIDSLVALFTLPPPHLTLFFDVSVHTAAIRRGERPADRIEAENEGFFERVRKGYLERAKNDPDRIVVIPSHGSLDQVSHAVEAALSARC